MCYCLSGILDSLNAVGRFMENWDFIKNGKFVCEETVEFHDEWASFPESTLRVHITCPKCSTRYRINHSTRATTNSYTGCGLDISVEDAITSGQCPYSWCKRELPKDIADCPGCGLRCRDISHTLVHSIGCWSFRALQRYTSKSRA